MIDIAGQEIKVDDFVVNPAHGRDFKLSMNKVLGMSNSIILLSNGRYCDSSAVLVVKDLPDEVKDSLNKNAPDAKLRFQNQIINLTRSKDIYKRGALYKGVNNFLILYKTSLHNSYLSILDTETRNLSDVINKANLKMFELSNMLKAEEKILWYRSLKVSKHSVNAVAGYGQIRACDAFTNTMLRKRNLMPYKNNLILLNNDLIEHLGYGR